jgi:GMP synthase-like glutamine amidotransferase
MIFQNAPGEGHGIFADVLDDEGWEQQVIHLYLDEPVPPDWEQSSLLVIMGGPMNVYQEMEFPFLSVETEIINMALKNDFPVIGFCLGAQLMAKVLGARVLKGQKKEIGWYPVYLTHKGKGDPFLRKFPGTFNAFQWHGDTFELPNGADLLVSSDAYFNQAMKIGTMSYGFQFHFEITKDMILEWVTAGRKEILEMGPDAQEKTIVEDTKKYLLSLHALGRAFFKGYLKKLERLRA